MKLQIMMRQLLKINFFLGLMAVETFGQTIAVDSLNKVSNPLLFSQTPSLYKLPIDKSSVKGSYPLAVSDMKTVHIIFPAKIREVDTGTPNIMVQITESFDNVLRVKSINMVEKQETNLTVLTEDGGLYSFLTSFDKNPEILNIKIGNNAFSDTQNSSRLGVNTFGNSDWIEESINQSLVAVENNAKMVLEKRNFVKNIGIKSQNIVALLKAIYNTNDIQYFKIDLKNESEIPFKIDFTKLYIKDLDKMKKSAIQQEELKIVKIIPNQNVVAAQSQVTIVLATMIKSLPSEKIMEIEIYEKDGGRHLRFQIEGQTLIKSKAL